MSGIGLYAPCQAEIAAVLTKMGVNLDTEGDPVVTVS